MLALFTNEFPLITPAAPIETPLVSPKDFTNLISVDLKSARFSGVATSFAFKTFFPSHKTARIFVPPISTPVIILFIRLSFDENCIPEQLKREERVNLYHNTSVNAGRAPQSDVWR